MLSPSRYVKQKKKELQDKVTPEFADLLLTGKVYFDAFVLLRIGEEVLFVLRNISEKYHKRIYSILALAYLRAVFEKSARDIKLQDKDRMIQRVL